MSTKKPTWISATGESTAFIPALGDKGKSITVGGANAFAPLEL